MSTKEFVLGMQVAGSGTGGGGTVVIPNIDATAETLPAGSEATVTKTGSNTNVVFNFGIPKGDQGEPGPQGPAGPQGPVGQGVPAGGTTGQVLAKSADDSYKTEWKNPTDLGIIPVLDIGSIDGTPPVQISISPEQVAQSQLENTVVQAVYQGITLHLQKIGQNASQVVFSGFASNSNIFFFVNIPNNQGTFNIVTVNGGSYTPGNGIAIDSQKISVRLSGTQGNAATIGEDGGLFVSAGSSLILESISITTPPNTTTYTAGQVFDNTGMVVTASYNFGLSQEITGYTVFPSGALTGDVNEITVTYSEGGIVKTATQPVTVNRMTGTLTLSQPSVELNAETPSAVVNITYNGDATVEAVSDNPEIVSPSIEDQTTLVVTSLSDTSQTVKITVSAPETGLYTAASEALTVYNYVTAQIYGAVWDGSATTKWSRTDAAELFSDPEPAVNNGTGSSPFDNIMPWSGMTRVSDPVAGELVQIPKYWYKWTQSGASLQLQIANAPQEGFYVSPAHCDRGDGQGERDIVYVGRYHCANDYTSKTAVSPIADISLQNARTGITSLGSGYWMYDWSMIWTIRMLYLVEFADWNCQKIVGYGCGNGSFAGAVGYTDAMEYHTGTSQIDRTTYGLGTQYRNIEGLWDNVNDLADGAYYNTSGILEILINPSEYSNMSGGYSIGRPPSGYPTEFSITEALGGQWICPTKAGGSGETYTSDNWSGSGSNLYAVIVGGRYSQDTLLGLFYTSYLSASSNGISTVGCRLMKLPNNT